MQIIGSTRRMALCALVAVATFTAGAAAQERRTPHPKVIERSEAVLAAVNGDHAAVDALVKNHFSEEYQKARSAEDRRKWFEPLRARLGKSEIARLLRRDPETFVIEVVGEKGKLNFVVTHEENTFLIKGLGVEEPGSGN